MQVNPYLFYDGNCEEALKYYQKVLGARIEAMLPYEGGPADMPIPARTATASSTTTAMRAGTRMPSKPGSRLNNA